MTWVPILRTSDIPLPLALYLTTRTYTLCEWEGIASRRLLSYSVSMTNFRYMTTYMTMRRYLLSALGFSMMTLSMSAHATSAPESQPDITTCPASFYAVKIHEEARQCQRFDAQMPASMVYFVNDSTDALVAFYLALMPDLHLKGEHNARILLTNDAGDVRVVVSPDGEGAQIDILVVADTQTSTESSAAE